MVRLRVFKNCGWISQQAGGQPYSPACLNTSCSSTTTGECIQPTQRTLSTCLWGPHGTALLIHRVYLLNKPTPSRIGRSQTYSIHTNTENETNEKTAEAVPIETTKQNFRKIKTVISNPLNEAFKVTVIKILNELERIMKEHSEKLNKEKT